MKTVKLGELCDINPKDAQPAKGTLVSFIPMQRVSETGLVDTTETRQSEEVVKGFSSFREGDILMAKITPCMENGKGGIAKGLCNGIGYGSTEFHVIRPTSPLIRTEWIYYYTTYPRFRKLCEQNMTGSAGQKRVPKSYLLGCPIPVPDLNTQDKVIHSLRSLRSIIELRNSQLAMLDELVKCRFVEMFGDVKNNPYGWVSATVDSVTKEIIGGVSVSGETRKIQKGELAVLKVSAVTYGVFKCDEYKVISNDIKLGKYVSPKKGDLLFSRANTKELVGATALVDKDYPHLLLPDKIWKIVVSDKVSPVYLKAYLSEPWIRELMSKVATGTSGSMYNISMEKLRQIPVILPPIEQQNTFTTFVRRIDKLRFSIQSSLEKTQQLFDSLMQEYFD